MGLALKLHKAFENAAKRVGLKVNNKEYSYSTLWALSESLIFNQLFCKSRRVGVLAGRELATYIAILSCTRQRKVFVPLNPKFPVDRLAYIIETADVDLIVYDSKYKHLVSLLEDRLPNVHFHLFDEASSTQSNIESLDVSPSDYAYILFTSGSTGTPKGVPITEENLESYLDYMVSNCELNQNDICSQYFDTSFDLSIHDIFVTWLSGACLAVLTENATLAPGPFIKNEQISCWFSVPSALAVMDKFKQLKPEAYPSVRKTFFCGEALLKTHADKWFQACPNTSIINLYGPTEATIACSAFEVKRGAVLPSIIPIGQPFPHMQFEISEEGELLIAGSQVTPGYLNNEAKNTESFCLDNDRRFYRSGDLVQADGQFGFLYNGRKDDQVKIQGYRVELKEIEIATLEVGDFNQAKAAIDSTTSLGNRIILFIDGCADTKITNKLKEKIPSYMIPSEVVYVGEMPLNVNGKIDKKQLLNEWRSNAKG